MKSNQIELVAHFVGIYYDYLFSFDKIIEFVYTDEEMCHLQLKVSSTIPKDKIVEMPNNSKINQFKFDIPKYILQKEKERTFWVRFSFAISDARCFGVGIREGKSPLPRGSVC